VRHLAERARPSAEPRRDTSPHDATIAKRLHPGTRSRPPRGPSFQSAAGYPRPPERERRVAPPSSWPCDPSIAMAVGSGFLWAVDSGQDVIRRIDASTKRVSGALRAGADPVAVAATHDALWVATRATTPFPRSTSGWARSASHLRWRRPGRDRRRRRRGVGGKRRRRLRDAHRPAHEPCDGDDRRGPRPQGIVVAGGSVWVTVRS
jgi:hypothetical protein